MPPRRSSFGLKGSHLHLEETGELDDCRDTTPIELRGPTAGMAQTPNAPAPSQDSFRSEFDDSEADPRPPRRYDLDMLFPTLSEVQELEELSTQRQIHHKEIHEETYGEDVISPLCEEDGGPGRECGGDEGRDEISVPEVVLWEHPAPMPPVTLETIMSTMLQMRGALQSDFGKLQTEVRDLKESLTSVKATQTKTLEELGSVK